MLNSCRFELAFQFLAAGQLYLHITVAGLYHDLVVNREAARVSSAEDHRDALVVDQLHVEQQPQHLVTE